MDADMYAMPNTNSNLKLDVYKPGGVHHISTHLYGRFNAYNMLAAISMARACGISFENIVQGADKVHSIPGRMERYELQNGAACFIDYAHNPSSYEAVLSTLRGMTDHLIVVFGAGGARDRGRRPLMGEMVDKFADAVILTADNPRGEDPEEIINDIVRGFSVDTKLTILREIDRMCAIEMACHMSRKGSIIAILGKGNDEYQIIGDLKFVFKERVIIQQFI
jgi:UDP-N-acetylmuramoyl-L-alanyl-D-glutamate--2,6-diaminopimelate ligase